MSDSQANDEMQRIGQFIDDFSRSLYLLLAKEKPKENLILSPISVQIVLAMALQGAKGKTESELLQGLKFDTKDKEIIQKGFKTLLSNLKGDGDITLNIANKIFADKTMQIKTEFSEILKNFFQSELGLVDFLKNPENSRVEINNWVADKTNQLIKDLLAQGIIKSDTRSVLVNAIHFKGKWVHQFKSEATAKGDFHVDENTTIQVDYMNIKKKFSYVELPDLNARAVELEYTGGTYSLLIVLPNEINGLAQLHEKIANVPLSDIRKNMYRPEVILKLPKFKIESTLHLNDPLRMLGMNSMFEDADFTGIADEPLVVSKVIQKAYIDVNEEGTEAAAATAISMVDCLSRTPNRILKITHPFLFYLMNKKGNNSIFVGRITNPCR